MKKLFTTFFIIILIIVNINFTHSFEWNKTQTIDYLINYTNSKISDIEKITKKYNLKDNTKLNKKIEELKDLKNILIKTKKTWKYDDYINKVIGQLKNNNNSIKAYIKILIQKKKEESKKYSILYSKKIKPITNKINNIVINISSKLIQKERINSKDRQIISLLYQIKLKLNKLEKITTISFNTKKDLQNYIINTFKQITFHFKQIKNIVKNTH